MRVHIVQSDIVWEDKAANHAHVREMLVGVGVAKGDLVVLPEMFDTGFSLNVERTHDGDGVSAAFVSELAKRLGAFVQAGVTAMGADGMGRNRCLVFSPGGEEIARYDKVHPFTFGREGERFAGGDRVTTYQWSEGEAAAGLRVCPAVCYDLRFPELFRAGLGLGAEMFALGANWPAPRAAHWRALMIARAIENQAFTMGANRCGEDPFLAYSGGSIVVSPEGEVLGEAGAEALVLSLDVDPEAVRSWREKFPAWRDGRADLLPRLGDDGKIGGGQGI
ncbi:MAG: carbon-nitrogen family hydrolase [Phycisphaeraceae bacterium]|nr:MAG: carbon-nitrogen family hydrolase [Phycisphaeraceae bacterium]